MLGGAFARVALLSALRSAPKAVPHIDITTIPMRLAVKASPKRKFHLNHSRSRVGLKYIMGAILFKISQRMAQFSKGSDDSDVFSSLFSKLEGEASLLRPASLRRSWPQSCDSLGVSARFIFFRNYSGTPNRSDGTGSSCSG